MEDYMLLIEVTRECNKLLQNVSLEPHQVKLVKGWETRPAEQIIQVIIDTLTVHLENIPKRIKH